MSYKIAVASSNGSLVDLSFGSADHYLIYEVSEDGSYERIDERKVQEDNTEKRVELKCNRERAKEDQEKKEQVDRDNCIRSCGCDIHPSGRCGSGKLEPEMNKRISLVKDCRCLLCHKIGARAERQLSLRAVTIFEVEENVTESIEKVVGYYKKVDQHLSLRRG